jgi:hypothetical protein
MSLFLSLSDIQVNLDSGSDVGFGVQSKVKSAIHTQDTHTHSSSLFSSSIGTMHRRVIASFHAANAPSSTRAPETLERLLLSLSRSLARALSLLPPPHPPPPLSPPSLSLYLSLALFALSLSLHARPLRPPPGPPSSQTSSSQSFDVAPYLARLPPRRALLGPLLLRADLVAAPRTRPPKDARAAPARPVPPARLLA